MSIARVSPSAASRAAAFCRSPGPARGPLPRAVINFVGGWLGGASPVGAAVNQSLMTRGATEMPPSLWLYGNQDLYYPLSASRANFAAFTAAGGKGAFHEFEPPQGLTGHEIISATSLWCDTLEAYLSHLRLPPKVN